MNVTEIDQLFISLTNEADQTFLTSANRVLYERSAYDEFRRIIAAVDPMFFITQATYTVTAATILPLSTGATRILGSTPTQAPMMQLMDVLNFTGATLLTANFGYRYKAVRSMSELMSVTGAPGIAGYGLGSGLEPSYLLQDNALWFGRPITDNLMLFYRPYPSQPDNPFGIDWTKHGNADNEFVDDLRDFHPLIAALAMRIYFARDENKKAEAQALIDVWTSQLVDYLQRGRDMSASRFVSVDY